MALWTADQIQRVREIVGRYHAAIALAVFGVKSLPPDLVKDLRGAGIPVPSAPQLIDDAYAYGQLLSLLRDPKMATKSPAEIAALVEQNKLSLRLTPQETAAVDLAKKHAGQYCVGLGTRVAGQVMTAVTGAESDLTPERMVEVIQDKTAANIAKREAIGKLKSDFGWQLGNWSRDWQRIATTESNNAIQEGGAAAIEKEYSLGELVSKIPRPDACRDCKRLYLDADGNPKVFTLRELRANGSNVGRRKTDWKPVVEAVHPWCGCMLVRVPKGTQWVDGELEPIKKSEHLEKARKLHGRLVFAGMQISIENRKGTRRRWYDPIADEHGSTQMRYHYGYIRRTEGTDGDHVDCYVGPDENASTVYVVHQQKKSKNGSFGGYDEDKAMLGFGSAAEAKAAYLAHYDDPRFFGSMTAMSVDEFKRKLDEKKGEKLTKSWQIPLVLDMTLEKGATHKYIARFPTGKDKPKYRYVYKYLHETRGGTRHAGQAQLLTLARVEVGAKFRDRGVGTGHQGHWTVTEKPGSAHALNDDHHITLTHDETGEVRRFGDVFTARSFLEGLHEGALGDETLARRQRQAALVRGALAGYAHMKEKFAANPHHVNALAKLSDQWERVISFAKYADLSAADWAKSFGVDDEPASWKKAFHEMRFLSNQLHRKVSNLHGTDIANAVTQFGEPELARHAARYFYLQDFVERRIEDEPSAIALDVNDVIKALGSDALEKPHFGDTLIAKIKALAKKKKTALPKGFRRKGLENVLLVDETGDISKNAAIRMAIRAVLQDELALAAFHVQAPVWALNRAYHEGLEDYEQKVGASPTPSMYADGWRAPSTGFEPGEAPPELTADERAVFDRTVAWDRDPIVHFDYPIGDALYPVRASVSAHKKAIEGLATEAAQTAIATHKERVAKYLPIFEETAKQAAKAIDDEWENLAAVVSDATEAARAGFVDVTADLEARLLAQKVTGASLVDAIDRVVVVVTQRARPLRDVLVRKVIERQLARIQSAAGGTSDLEQVNGRLRSEWTPAGQRHAAEELVKASRAYASGDAAPLPELYDIANDPGQLKRLLRFVDPDVAPEVRIEVHANLSRAHATDTNVVRVGKHENSAALWHEYAHAIEHDSKGITEAANTLRDERGKYDELLSLNAVSAWSGYSASETTYKDEWFQPYIGKWYGHMSSTEVLSVGTEHFMADPEGLHRKDPQLFGFVVAALTGKLGKRDGERYRTGVRRGRVVE